MIEPDWTILTHKSWDLEADGHGALLHHWPCWFVYYPGGHFVAHIGVKKNSNLQFFLTCSQCWIFSPDDLERNRKESSWDLLTYPHIATAYIQHFITDGNDPFSSPVTDQRSDVGQRLANALYSTQYGPWHLGGLWFQVAAGEFEVMEFMEFSYQK